MNNDIVVTTNLEAMAGGSRPLQVNTRTDVAQLRTPRGLLTNSALRGEEWKEIDAAIVRAATQPLRAVADLRARGLVKRLGGLGTMISQFSLSGELTAANVTMSGQTEGESDRLDHSLAGVPIPVIFKPFSIGARELDASRRMGDALDTSHAIAAARVVAEMAEQLLIDGGGFTFNGATIYGYTNHPNRNTDTAANYGGGDWGTITNVMPTVAGMIAAAQADGYYGPYMLYAYTTQWAQAAHVWYTDGSGTTPAQRILSLPDVLGFQALPTLQAGEVVLVQMAADVVDWAYVPGFETPTVLEWASGDGMTNHFKVLMVGAPRVKANYGTGSGIVHATAA